MKTLLPARLAAAQGLFQRHFRAAGRMIFTAGVVGWDEHEMLRLATRLPASSRQALRTSLAILAEDGAGPEHIVRMTCYVTDIDANIAPAATRSAPPGKAIMGKQLSGDGAGRGQGAWSSRAAKVEIEATAVVPE